MSNLIKVIAGSVLLVVTGAAQADASLSSLHNPVVDTPRNNLVRACIEAVQDHWRGDGLVLKRKAKHGYTDSGTRVITVRGTVWKDSKRVPVFHQCSVEPGSKQLSLFVEQERSGMVAVKN